MWRRLRTAMSAFGLLVAMLLLGGTPASAGGGNIQFDGVAAGVTECAGLSDIFGLDMEGDNLVGCLINTSFEGQQNTPSGVYIESGTETFIGCLYEDGVEVGCGSFDTTYLFSARFDPETGAQQFGRCQHPIVPGTGTGVFEGATGRIDFKDDIDAGLFDFRGHVSIG